MILIPRRTRALLGTVALVATLSSACSGSGGDDASPALDLSPAALVGQEIARDAGCMSCHGVDGAGGGVGPGWQGVAGSVRPLDDGTEVVADRAYLTRAIMDPGAEKVDGFAVAMPLANLTDKEVSSIVDYLEELK